MECDRVALGITRKKPKLIGDEIWKFERVMRKLNYARSNKKLSAIVLKLVCRNLGMKLGFSIPHNVFGPGLAIVHYGNIVVSNGARIGENCRIHSGVNIGANAVVVKDVEEGLTVGGIPAKKISDNDSSKHLKKATETVKKIFNYREKPKDEE